ncbi:CheR family methyltransferase [Gayadomonas joobiniege]|uniref:CheR family methyltransferase n=1 Tax=Gayadomonas joobiniege TaxID=1234606 RepID=UPI00037F6062|nr:protein-glutamate O-methyltransferase CheR [Gayadomonas joobiniege]
MLDKSIRAADYEKFCRFLEHQCGILLGENKQYLVKSRLSPLLVTFNATSLSDLINRAMSVRERELRLAVVDAMTTNETLWFRDSYPFNVLGDTILPEFAQRTGSLKVWSAAASSGQEAYSIAMTALERQNQLRRPINVRVLGTDISNQMIAQCKKAEYEPLALARGLSLERKQRFFEPAEKPGAMRVTSKVRQMVDFRHLNLLDSYALLGKFDVIFCRNVLIYFSPQNKQKILNQLAQSLNPNGYLFLGASESISGFDSPFKMQRCNPGIVYRLA